MLEKLSATSNRGARPARLRAAGRGHRYRLELGASRGLRGLTRSPTPIFNEKTLAGLGREVQTKGLLAADAVEKALAALKRFRALCDTMRVEQLWVLATAACRDARNGHEFIAEAEKICRTRIDVISGQREAELTALGVVSGFHRPDGIVGDLGGGSLELVDVHGARIRAGITLPLGGLALQDRSDKSIKKAEKIVKAALGKVPLLKGGKGRTFYAVGGTWRSLAQLHMAQTGYPLHVMHGYVIRAREALEFSRLVRRVNPETLSQIEVVSTLPAGRCCPMRRWCSSTSCAWRSRATSCSRRSACARGCCTRCSTPRSARRTRCWRRRRNSTGCARARRSMARN